MKMKTVCTLIFLAFALTTAPTHAGVIAMQAHAEGGTNNQFEVGESIKVSVTLDSIQPGRLLFWGADVTIPETFSQPTDFQFSHMPLPIGAGLAASSFSAGSSGHRVSHLFLAAASDQPASFSFHTTAVQAGKAELHVSGFALSVVPGQGLVLSDQLTDTLSLTTFNTTSGETPAPASHAPEPTSMAIFAVLAAGAGLGRRKRSVR